MKELFIDENINILTNEKAQEALEKENDKKYLSQNGGIYKVPEDRWVKAQITEKKHWLIRGIKKMNDRNDYHNTQFDDYKILEDKSFKEAIELGCGPFTNTRIIGKKCRISEISLVDPLIDEYLLHSFVTYNRRFLYLHNSDYLLQNVATHFPSGYKLVLRFLHQKLKIGEIFNTPIEQLQTNKKFDLIILINVIENCYDVLEVFNKIFKMCSHKAIFIFEDKLYDHEIVKEQVGHIYDAAHPLRVDRN